MTLQDPAARRPTAKHDRKRAEIVAAATREINAHGVQGLLLSEVAARVGMTKANLTYYFKRKEDLAALCFNATLAAYQQMVEAAAAHDTAPARFETLFGLVFARAAEVETGTAPELVTLGGLRGMDEPHATAAMNHYNTLLRETAALFDAPGGAHIDRAGRLSRAHLVLTHFFWTQAWLGQCDPGDYPRMGRRLYELVAGGLALPGAPPADPGGALPSPPGRDADPERAAFYRAATRLINQFGYRGASVERIGAAVNVTKGSVYHHHQSKEEVVMACAERSFANMWAIIRAVEAGAGDRWDQLSRLVHGLIRFQVGESGPFLRAAAASALTPGLREQVATQWNRVTMHFAGLAADGMTDGTVRLADPFLAAQTISASINAADEIHLFRPDGPPSVITALCARPTLWGLFCDNVDLTGPA